MAGAGVVIHLAASDWEVKDIPLQVAQELVRRLHYSQGGANTAVYRHGLFHRGDDRCLGVAWWIPPTKGAAIATHPSGDWRRVLSLSRLAIEPEVPTNGASFLIGRSIRMIRRIGAWDCLVTYADEGQDHDGAIYRATNWEYVGKTTPERRWVDAEGRMVSRKKGPRTYTKQEMIDMGYTAEGPYAKHKFRMVLR